MPAIRTLTRQQSFLRLLVTLATGLLLLTLLDLFWFSIAKQLDLPSPHNFQLLFSSVLIVGLTFISSKYNSKQFAIWTSILLSIFEWSTGEILYIHSTNGELIEPWPPIYLFAIIFYTAIFYFIARLINNILHKTSIT